MEYHSYVSSRHEKLFFGYLHKILAVEYHTAACRFFKQVDTAHKRALAGSRKSDYAEYLSVVNRKINVFERLYRTSRGTEHLVKIFYLDHVSLPLIKKGQESKYVSCPKISVYRN